MTDINKIFQDAKETARAEIQRLMRYCGVNKEQRFYHKFDEPISVMAFYSTPCLVKLTSIDMNGGGDIVVEGFITETNRAFSTLLDDIVWTDWTKIKDAIDPYSKEKNQYNIVSLRALKHNKIANDLLERCIIDLRIEDHNATEGNATFSKIFNDVDDAIEFVNSCNVYVDVYLDGIHECATLQDIC